jgi:hypothetical protein
MVRWRHVIAPALAVASLACAAEARAAVVFVDRTPPVLTLERDAQARVVLLNAGPSRQRVSLRVVGGPNGEITIAPVKDESEPKRGGEPEAGGRAFEDVEVERGDTRAFTITLKTPPAEPAARSLLAGSTDGTVARIALHGGQLPALPADFPETLDMGVKKVDDAATIALVGLPGARTTSKVGRLYDAGRHEAKVTIEPPNVLTVAGPDPGTYSGQIDVNGAAAGGTSTLTLRVRDGLLWPLVWLLLGIAVGWVIEWWLTRLRPRALLDRRLGRLVARTRTRQQRVDRTLRKLFADSRGIDDVDEVPANQAWSVPRVVADDPSQVRRYYLSRAGIELARGLNAARTDPERELFGPDGDKFKELLGDEDTYAELVGNLREAAEIARPALIDLQDVGNIPMRKRLDYECGGWVIGDKQSLAARNEAAKALQTAAEEFAEYRRRLQRAEILAADAPLAATLADHRRLVEDTFRGDEDRSHGGKMLLRSSKRESTLIRPRPRSPHRPPARSGHPRTRPAFFRRRRPSPLRPRLHV